MIENAWIRAELSKVYNLLSSCSKQFPSAHELKVAQFSRSIKRQTIFSLIFSLVRYMNQYFLLCLRARSLGWLTQHFNVILIVWQMVAVRWWLLWPPESLMNFINRNARSNARHFHRKMIPQRQCNSELKQHINYDNVQQCFGIRV